MFFLTRSVSTGQLTSRDKIYELRERDRPEQRTLSPCLASAYGVRRAHLDAGGGPASQPSRCSGGPWAPSAQNGTASCAVGWWDGSDGPDPFSTRSTTRRRRGGVPGCWLVANPAGRTLWCARAAFLGKEPGNQGFWHTLARVELEPSNQVTEIFHTLLNFGHLINN